MQALEESRAAAAAAMQAADQARHQAAAERREREALAGELELLRDALASEQARRQNAERLSAAAEYAATTAAEDADYARELLEQANHRTPARPPPLPDYAPPRSRPHSRGAGQGAQTAANATLQAAAEAAELLEELKGGLRVSIEHQRALQDQRERYAQAPPPPPALGADHRERPKYSRPASPVQRADALRASAAAKENWSKASAHARGMSYGRQLNGRAPNLGYARDGAPGAYAGAANNATSPYLNPGSASARASGGGYGGGGAYNRTTSGGSGGAYAAGYDGYGGYVPEPRSQWATPSLRRAKKHVAGADEDYAREAATAPQDMGPTALEQARREYAADKRLALERRRARMMAEEGAARA